MLKSEKVITEELKSIVLQIQIIFRRLQSKFPTLTQNDGKKH
jgi:hypothetical protein